MTRIYQYTDGATGGSISAILLPFGAALTRPATRAAMYVRIYDAFAAAGWTPSPMDLGVAGDNTYASTGESSAERFSVRVRYSAGVFYFYVGTKLDGTGLLQGSIGGGTGLHEAWSVAADVSVDAAFFGTKDFLWMQFRVVATEITYSAFLGGLEREAIVNPNAMLTTGAVVAGATVSLPVGSDPHALGFRVGDWLQIVELASASAAAAETRRIVGLTTTSIIVDFLSVGYASGAIVGSLPMPISRYVSTNTTPSTVASWYSPFNLARGVSDLGETVYTDLAFATGLSYANNTDLVTVAGLPNNRTRRYGCRTIQIGHSNAGAQWGRVPGLAAYPKTTANFLGFYAHDTGTYDRVDTTAAGTGDGVNGIAGTTSQTLTVVPAPPFTVGMVGQYIQIWNSGVAANDGSFLVTAAGGAGGTEIVYDNPTPGVPLGILPTTANWRVAPLQRFIGARFENTTGSTPQSWIFGRMP